ncbi:MAG: ATP-binding protein [Spirochaetales bacterium]|nr:ATP-binding protein [Spirochaetales bacterium]
MKITIASGKGGTGKTTLSTNLASYIAETRECVLSDLDVEEPNSGLFIKAELVHEEDKFKMIPEWEKSKCELCGNCQVVCNFNAVLKMWKMIMVFPELCHGCYACSELCPTGSLPMKQKKMGELKSYKNGNLNFIESKLIIGEEQAVPLIKQTIDYADENFGEDVIKIFDSPPGTSCPVIEATKDADFVILVTEPTPFGLHDLKLAVETVKQMDKPFGVVINRDGIGNDGVELYCKEENIDIIARIPNDRLIAETYSRGDLLYPTIPSVKEAVKSISSYIDNFKGQIEGMRK